MDTKIKVVISGSFRKHIDDIGIALVNFKKANIKILAPLTKEIINSKNNFIFLTTDDLKKSADILEKEFMANIKKQIFCILQMLMDMSDKVWQPKQVLLS